MLSVMRADDHPDLPNDRRLRRSGAAGSGVPAPAPGRRRSGRPARLDREMIANAASEVGLDGLTLKAVADRLGVSVPSLYHHVDGRDDLMRLAAEHTAAQIAVPADRGQGWAEWLLEWARYAYEAFVAQPDLLDQWRQGSISADRMVLHIDAAMDLLTRQGFSAVEARDAFELASECAIGAAVNRLRESGSPHDRDDRVALYHRVLSRHAPDELPHLRRLAAEYEPPPALDDRIVTVLVGIAVRRAEPWQPIQALVAGADVIPLRP